jgi:hypothetical protein
MTVQIDDYWWNFAVNFTRGALRPIWYVGLMMIAIRCSKRFEERREQREQRRAARTKTQTEARKATPSGAVACDS